MAAKTFIVELDAQERAGLNALISKGKAPAKAILKARILLKADQAEGARLARCADRQGTGTSSSARSCRQCTSTRSAARSKNDLKPHLTDYWVIPPKGNAGLRRRDGGGARRLYAAARSGPTAGLSRRNQSS